MYTYETTTAAERMTIDNAMIGTIHKTERALELLIRAWDIGDFCAIKQKPIQSDDAAFIGLLIDAAREFLTDAIVGYELTVGEHHHTATKGAADAVMSAQIAKTVDDLHYELLKAGKVEPFSDLTEMQDENALSELLKLKTEGDEKFA